MVLVYDCIHTYYPWYYLRDSPADKEQYIYMVYAYNIYIILSIFIYLDSVLYFTINET